MDFDANNVLQVYVGTEYTALMTRDGDVYFCGNNERYPIRFGQSFKSNSLVKINHIPKPLLGFTTNYYQTLALTKRAFFKCENASSKRMDPCSFTKIKGPPGKILTICGDGAFVFINTDKGLFAFGANNIGQLGLEKNSVKSTNLPKLLVRHKTLKKSQLMARPLSITESSIFATGSVRARLLGLDYPNRFLFTEVDAPLISNISKLKKTLTPKPTSF